MKFYVVKSGRIPGIYQMWEECKKQVDGYSGAKYKSFENEEDARKYYYENINDTEEAEVDVYVDGSFDETVGKYAYGCVMLKGNTVIDTLQGCSSDEKYVDMKNVAGEVKAAMEAISWAIKNGCKSIRIYHDYEGIASWAVGDWSANKKGTQEYVEFVADSRKQIQIYFTKVRGHSGNKYNEMADKLAREGLKCNYEICDCIQHFAEYLEKMKNTQSSVELVVGNLLFSEKLVLSYVKKVLKDKKIKKITNVKVCINMNTGITECTFDQENESRNIHLRIFEVEETRCHI